MPAAALPHLNINTYFAYQAVAIVTPPVVFVLLARPHKPPWRDLTLNIVLSILGWIPGIIHASYFLHKTYRAGYRSNKAFGNNRISSFFPITAHDAISKAKYLVGVEPVPVPTNAQQNDTVSNASHTAVVNGHSRAFKSSESSAYLSPVVIEHFSDDSSMRRRHSTLGPLPGPGPGSPQIVPRHRDHAVDPSNKSIVSVRSIQASIKSSVGSVLSKFTHASDTPENRQHRDDCDQCTLCPRCFEQWNRDRKDPDFGSLVSLQPCLQPEARKRHRDSGHHVKKCLCEACTGDDYVPPDYGEHVRGCQCKYCLGEDHDPPREWELEPNAWMYGKGKVTGQVGGMGFGY